VLSRVKWLASTIITLAVIAGFFIGGLFGVIGAITCFGLGSWYIASRAKFTIRRDQTERQPLLDQSQPAPERSSELLVMVKEVHAYSPSAIGSAVPSNNSKTDFELFIHVWLVSQTEMAKQIKDAQLRIRDSPAPISAERIVGDLDKWYLDSDKEKSDMWDTYFERVRERLVELNMAKLIECGVPVEGWLHFRVRNISPSEYTAARMELCIDESSSVTHVGIVNSTRYLSGQARVCALGDPPHISPLENPMVGA